MTHPMASSELRAIGERVYGHGWQTRLAERLEVAARTVRRWAAGDPIPPGAAEDIRSLAADADEQRRLEDEAYAAVAPHVDAIVSGPGAGFHPADVLAGIMSRAVEHMREGAGTAATMETLRQAINRLKGERDT